MSDAISCLLADAYVARHAPAPLETAAAFADRHAAEWRAAALTRVLADLRRGVEPREADIAPLWANPAMHLAYLDARDEALAFANGELTWDHSPREGDGDGDGEP